MEARDTKRLAEMAEERALESEFQSRVLFVFTIVTVIFVCILILRRLWLTRSDADLVHLQPLRDPQPGVPEAGRQHQLEHQPHRHGDGFVRSLDSDPTNRPQASPRWSSCCPSSCTGPGPRWSRSW